MKTKSFLFLSLTLLNSVTMVAQTTSVVRTDKIDEKTGFKWTEVKNGELLGAEVNGKVVVPCKYTDISYSSGFFDVYSYKSQLSACYKENGNCIIPESRGYESISSFMYQYDSYISVRQNKNEGACDSEGKEIVSPKLGYEQVSFNKDKPGLCSVKKNGCWGLYNYTLSKEVVPVSLGCTSIHLWSLKNNKVEVEKGKTQGVVDIISEKVIIPFSRGYTNISMSVNSDYYMVKKDGFVGVCDLNGNELISPSRGYTEIVKQGHNGVSYFGITRDNKSGACDMNGKEIVEPKYESLVLSQGQFMCKVTADRWQSIGIRGDGSKISGISEPTTQYTTSSKTSLRTSSSSSSSRSSSSSSYSSSSSSSSGKLLKNGTFTDTGVFRVGAQIARSGQPKLLSFTIYEKKIVDGNGKEFFYQGNIQFDNVDSRVYGSLQSLYYLVSNNGNELKKVETNKVMGIDVSTVYYYTYGDARAQFQGNAYYPNMNGAGSGGNQGSSTIQYGYKKCNSCSGQKKCSVCHGKGRVMGSYNTGSVNCGACGGDGNCNRCNGTGQIYGILR